MDRSLDERIAERQRASNRARRAPPPPRRNNYDYPRDGVRKVRISSPLPYRPVVPPSRRDDRADLDNDWVHDRYDDESNPARGGGGGGGGGGGFSRPRYRKDDRDDDYLPERDREPPPARLRVDNLHYDLTEDDINDLFTRIAPVMEAKLRYDRAGRSEGIAFVTYRHVADARTAIREFDGANAKGQPIRLTLLPLPRRDNPFDRVENPRSLFDRIEAPSGRRRRRSDSPMSDADEERATARRGGSRRGPPPPRERRSDVTKPPPENIDRYVPGESNGRSSSLRGGRRLGERRERGPRRDEGGHKLVNGRPRKTAEELDAEMDDYWGGGGGPAAPANTQAETVNVAKTEGAAPGPAAAPIAAVDDIDMIE